MISAIDAIKKRKSTRNYNYSHLIEDEKKDIVVKLASDHSRDMFRMELVTTDLEGVKLGTYGFISGASSYIVGIVRRKDKETTVAFGKQFEKLILELTALDLQTCWMAGSYRTDDFTDAVDLGEDESIVIVSPVGYEKGEMRKRDRLLRLLSHRGKRKPWSELFFEEEWKTALSEESADEYKRVLDMVRIAPSANNGQPWRVVKKGDCYHFYLRILSSKALRGFNCGYNDLGIALCHFEESARELGLEGEWIYRKDESLQKRGREYIMTWVAKSPARAGISHEVEE